MSARALGLPLTRIDEIAKMVPDTLNIKLIDALDDSADLKAGLRYRHASRKK